MRTLAQLTLDQARVLAAYRRRLPDKAEGGGPRQPRDLPVPQWGQVSDVVTSDPDYGPHLVVQPHVLSGLPPGFFPSPTASLRCYPPPGKAVSDYAVNEFVRLAAAASAMIAERLA